MRVFALLILLLVSAPMTRAQDSTWPPDPADIFTDRVEVVWVATTPIRYDNEARVLYFRNHPAMQWEAYPYPHYMTEIINLGQRSDNVFILFGPNAIPYYPQHIEDVWLFSPDTREFSRHPVMCGQQQAIPGEGNWVLYETPDGQQQWCFTENGAMTQALPDVEICDSPVSPDYSNSPDKLWVIFSTCEGRQARGVYAYQTSTDQLHFLGNAVDRERIYVDHWLNATTPVLYGNTYATQQRNFVYIADVRRENSLELIASQYLSTPQYFDSPPRYVWIGEHNHGIYEYNLETQQQTFLAQTDCDDSVHHCIAVPNNTFPDVSGNASLIAMLDRGVQSDFSTLTVYEIATGKTIYDLNFMPSAFGAYDKFHLLRWLDANTLFLMEYEGYARYMGHLITFTDDTVSETRINHLVSEKALSPNGRYLLQSDETEAGFIITAWDRITDEIIPLTQPIETLPQFVFWNDDNTLQLPLHENWTVRILSNE